jgi:hypothetical protein
MDGGGVHSDLLEHSAMHHAHDAAATLGARMIGALPGLAGKTPRRIAALRQPAGQVVFKLLKGRTDAVAQGFKPGACSVLDGSPRRPSSVMMRRAPSMGGH